jgi:hypothetical protein
MWRSLLWCVILLNCSWFSGCTPTAEMQLDEQKNPYYLAGKEKQQALDPKGAIESFERAIEDNPRSALAHYELGVLYEQQENDYASALYHYNKALKLRPNEYPADNIRQRIPGCKQELVKADSLATINPALLNEVQTLRNTNQLLLREVYLLRVQLASRLVPVTHTNDSLRQAPPQGARNGLEAPDSSAGTKNPPVRPTAGSSPRITTLPSSGMSRGAGGGDRRSKTYSVRMGDTPSSIARQQGIKLEALLAANPGLDPKRMKVGQRLNLPAS